MVDNIISFNPKIHAGKGMFDSKWAVYKEIFSFKGRIDVNSKNHH